MAIMPRSELHLPWRKVQIGGGPPISTSLTENEATWLSGRADGGVALEVGSAYGFSAIMMARAAKHVFAIDPHAGENAGSLDIMRMNLFSYEVEKKVTMIVGRSNDVLPYMQPHGFDLIFIDGCHEPDAVIRDVQNAIKLLSPYGVIACHDYHNDICPDVGAVLDKYKPPDKVVDSLWISRSLSRL